MRDVFIVADNILSPIGHTTRENFDQLKNGTSGIVVHQKKAIADKPFYASLCGPDCFTVADHEQYSRFERLLINSISAVLKNCNIGPGDAKTGLIISSTKGNISLLESEIYNPELRKRIALTTSAKLVAAHFGFVNRPVVVSNACVSGIMAILTAKRLITSGQYENVVVAGADVISKFILSGFQAFMAISATPCKPFDKNRDGITLGEGAAAMVFSANQNSAKDIKVLGGAISNDANHISAPSRTGEELAKAINKTFHQAQLKPDKIDFVAAHGTATVYNDEMEAKAITIAGLQSVPVNSLKGYFGHTLGAAGLIESIVAIQSLRENLVIPTLGFNEIGVSTPINVNTSMLSGDFNNCLKTASGFGGCNAAVAFGK